MRSELVSALLERVIHNHAYVPVLNENGSLLYYAGRRRHPEVHLRHLLVYHCMLGFDILDRAVYDQIVTKAYDDILSQITYQQELIDRLDRFAELFWYALNDE